MAFDTKKFLARFIEEARKQIAELSQGLLSLEQQPEDEELISKLFRCAHTVKGSANMMNLPEISGFAHLIENNLSSIRDKSCSLTKGHTDILLQALDVLSGMIAEAESEEPISEADGSIIEQLTSFAEKGTPPAQSSPVTPPSKESGEQDEDKQPKKERRKRRRDTADTITIKTEKLDELINLVSELSIWNRNLEKNLKNIAETVDISESIDQMIRDDDLSEISYQIKQLAESSEQLSTNLQKDIASLYQLDEELKDTLFELRMVPLAMVFERFPRVVREIAAGFNKKIDFRISGEETELDKKVIDMIDESLIHIIRNAVDHGIESEEIRARAGKPVEGTIHLKADYSQGMCRIIITDDGAGIDIETLTRKALAKGAISSDEAQRMLKNPTGQELAELLFTPGLSSSSIITDLSGRGVGMDIVHENIIKRLGGTILVETQAGSGTSMTLLLPLNTAIMQMTMFRIGNKSIALPTHNLLEIMRVSADEFINVVNRHALRLREQILPLIKIDTLMRCSHDEANQPLILIIKTSNGQAALLADDILNQDSYVIHSLPEHMQNTPWISGCIITGTDEIVNVLNTAELTEYSQEHGSIAQKSENKDQRSTAKILVVDDSVSTRDIEKSIIESYGYSVDLASDGMEAFEIAEENSYQCIVSDIEMPRMDGFALTKRLRGIRKYRNTPVILVSSRDTQEDKVKGIQAGADAYIVKSAFDQDNLIKTIRTLIGR